MGIFSDGTWHECQKTLAKITKKHHDVLNELYVEGEQNCKYTPDEAVKIIKERENKDGTKTFAPEEWLTAVSVI